MEKYNHKTAITNSVKQSLWGANSHSGSQEIPSLLWNLRVHYCVNKSLALVSILSQLNPIHILTPSLNTDQEAANLAQDFVNFPHSHQAMFGQYHKKGSWLTHCNTHVTEVRYSKIHQNLWKGLKIYVS